MMQNKNKEPASAIHSCLAGLTILQIYSYLANTSSSDIPKYYINISSGLIIDTSK
jgi:hypothetical protein